MALLILNGLFLLLSCVILVPVLTVLAQVALATVSRDPSGDSQETEGQQRLGGFVVLMPAHDEAAGIETPIRSVLAQCGARDRILVVADNCSDETAVVARAAGAEVIERHDPNLRGKGHALDFGVRWLEKTGEAPPVVIVVDADCIVAPPGLERLARACLASGRPVQGLYLMHSPKGAPLSIRIAEFAWVVKNKLRPLGSAALGWPCQLMGTGMAFPWSALRRAELASGHLVEDMQLGLELAKTGSPPLFSPDAVITSLFPVARDALDSQRARWEHGHISVIAGVVPKMLWRALQTGDAKLAGMVLDVAVPPLAALMLSIVGLLAVDVAWWWWLSGSGTAAGVTFAALLLMTVTTLVAWGQEGQRIIDGRELIGLPFYALAKIPIYIRVFTKRQMEWVRTKRDERHD